MAHNKWTSDDERMLQELQLRKEKIIKANTQRLVKVFDGATFDPGQSIPKIKDAMVAYMIANAGHFIDALSYFSEVYETRLPIDPQKPSVGE